MSEELWLSHQALCDESALVGWLLETRDGAGEQVEIQSGGCCPVVDPRVSGTKFEYLARLSGLVPKLLLQSSPWGFKLPSVWVSSYLIASALLMTSQGLKHGRGRVGWGVGHQIAPPQGRQAPWEGSFSTSLQVLD